MTKNMRIINLAKSEVGYKETGNNRNKYAKDFDDLWPTFYNGRKNGAAWCDVFVDWLFATCFGPKEAMRMLYQPERSCGAGCKFSAQYYRCHNAFDKTPTLGAQIFFGKEGAECHTGIVVGINGNYVTTVEGNSMNGVRMLSYEKTSPNIVGYGHQLYDDITEIKYEGPWPTIPKKGYFQKGDKGVNVQRMQQFLKWYDQTLLPRYGCDGDFGSETKTAVIAFETKEGIKPDGLFGPVCLAKAKTIRK